MVQWTDSNINWQSLSAKEIRGLINSWGKDGTVKTARKAAPAKKVAAKVTRQRHHGADGEVKFVPHRNLYVGFWAGKVVVTKRTEEACRVFLAAEFNAK